jgi:hypothetical protein
MLGKKGTYRIKVKGRLDENWSDRLSGMKISSDSAAEQTKVTTLTVRLRD